MRISELAEATGVSVATIKYYVREGLLSHGRKVSERLADYDDTHVRRLRMLRVLRDVGAVPVGALKTLVDATQNRSSSVREVLIGASDALRANTAFPEAGGDHARELADQLVDLAGWTEIRADAPERDYLAGIIKVALDSGIPPNPEGTVAYLGLVDAIASHEVGQIDATGDREALIERMIIGQVVLGELLVCLRRLAYEHHSGLRFGGTHENDAAGGLV